MFKEKCNCQYEQGHSIACPLYKERAFKPIWEAEFENLYSAKVLGEYGSIFKNDCINFIRQTIKTERELAKREAIATFPNPSYSQAEVDRQKQQAVKEAYQSPEFTDVFEFGKKQAVKNALEEVEKGLPKLTLHICRFNDGDCVCECFDNCLKLIRKLINKLKAKYDKA